jgi:hypothetical protein
LLKRLSFLHFDEECLCQKSGGYSWVDSFMGLLFCSTGFQVCFGASTMLFLLLWLCSMIWSLGIVIPPAVALFAQYCLGYLWSLCIHKNFRVEFSASVKNVIGIMLLFAFIYTWTEYNWVFLFFQFENLWLIMGLVRAHCQCNSWHGWI